MLLLETFEGVSDSRLLAALDKLHPTESSDPESRDHLEIVKLDIKLLFGECRNLLLGWMMV